jgi:hypothetical protein
MNYKYINSLKLKGSITEAAAVESLGGIGAQGIVSGALRSIGEMVGGVARTATRGLGYLEKGDENDDTYMQQYRGNGKQVFVIRGTEGFDDLMNDVLTFYNEKVPTGSTQAVQQKINLYFNYIVENWDRDSDVVIAGHSLGSLDTNYIMRQLLYTGAIPRNKITSLGFSYPVWNPPINTMDRAYSFDGDPLHNSLFQKRLNQKNIKTLTKDPDEYVNPVLHPIKRFENFHSTKNYYTGKYKIIS